MSYIPAAILSVLAHGFIIFLVIKGWALHADQQPVKPPAYIKATLVDIKAQAKPGAPQQKPKPKKIDLQKKRQEQERLKKQAAEKSRQAKIAKEKAEQKKLAEKKAQKTKLKKEQEALQQQAKLEQQKLEQERLQENLNKERERIEAEQRAEQLAQQVEDDKLLSQSYSDLIRKRIEQNWSRPPSARNNMKTVLSITMIPTGEVIDVVVSRSSGSAAYDRSAIQAVKKVRQFPEIKDMPSRIFEQEFRQFKLIFSPQDLRQ